MKPQYNPLITPFKNFTFAYEKGLLEGQFNARKELIEEFIEDLEYIETIKSYNNVFDRVAKVKKKWEERIKYRISTVGVKK